MKNNYEINLLYLLLFISILVDSIGWNENNRITVT